MKSRIKNFGLRWLPKVIDAFLSERVQNYILQVMLQSEITKIRDEVGSSNKPTRDAWLEQALAKIPAGSSILDAGAGELQYKKYCPHLRYTSQDFAQYDGQGNAKGLQIGGWDNSQLDIISDITAIPVQSASFDAAMCIEVLEHLPHPVAALQEIVRVLKPGGLLVVTAPFASITHFAPYYYSNGFSTYFYEYWAKEFNLVIHDLQLNGNYFDYIAQEIRRLPDISSQYANEQVTNTDRVLLNALLGKLSVFSEKGATSSELLTFGIHMLAEKRR